MNLVNKAHIYPLHPPEPLWLIAFDKLKQRMHFIPIPGEFDFSCGQDFLTLAVFNQLSFQVPTIELFIGVIAYGVEAGNISANQCAFTDIS
ncbi:hypothetical protein M9194_03930 [Vibrio sp. S4M6]|uniref:hypothetical protein n=1 Tax=Vibrio sinus TaxID=2946865 RepID=UPI00202A35A0|nr:hypothetical protein [Vibrio sinus]MCL9780583.1 hypothetical protein [Vibrio sinus]